MEYLLFAIVVLQFGFIVWRDIRHSQERELLERKLMSKNFDEYREIIEPPPQNGKIPEPPSHIPVDEVPIEKLMGAEDRL